MSSSGPERIDFTTTTTTTTFLQSNQLTSTKVKDPEIQIGASVRLLAFLISNASGFARDQKDV
jgi:hypothetical protein